MSFLNPKFLEQGGPMIWVLALLGLVGLMLFIERTLYLHRVQIGAAAFLSGIKNSLAKRRLVEALTVCEQTPGPVAAVVKAALFHAEDSPEAMRFQVQAAALVELPSLERRIGGLAAIAQVAPLVGLLGTVIGMVVTALAFQRDYMSASALARGLGQALFSLGGSLMLAIPAHLAGHFLRGRVRALVRDMEWAGNEIMRYLTTEYRSGPSEPEKS